MHLFQSTAWTGLRWGHLYIEKYFSVCVPSEVIILSLAPSVYLSLNRLWGESRCSPSCGEKVKSRETKRDLWTWANSSWDRCQVISFGWCWKTQKEQRRVFRLLLLSHSNVFCHRLILIQQTCERCSLLPTFLPAAAAPSVPFLALGRFWQSLYLSMNTHGCLWIDFSVWGLLHRLLSVGSDVSWTVPERKMGIERCFMHNWMSGLIKGTWTWSFPHFFSPRSLSSGVCSTKLKSLTFFFYV